MKKLISILGFTLIIAFISISSQSCNSTTEKNNKKASAEVSENPQSDQIKAYYFHATRRCETCQAVEAVAIAGLKEFYGDKITLEIFNREKDENSALVNKYKISGQTLLIIKGDQVVDLTTEAFLNARTNPDKLKNKIKSTIDAMI